MLSKDEITTDLEILKNGFNSCIRKIKEFEILNEKLVPEGLKPHTRSIAWLAEQVIVQGVRKFIDGTGFESVVANDSDIGLHDCIVRIRGNDTLVNLKVTNVEKTHTKNDINKAYKIQQAFIENPDMRFYYVIIKISFDNTKIKFVDEPPIVFYVPWIHDVYVNPSNHHLQAGYDKPPTFRSVQQFVGEIENEIVSKNLPKR